MIFCGDQKNLSFDTSMFSRAMEYGSKVQKAYQSGGIIDEHGCLTDSGLTLKQKLIDAEFDSPKEIDGDYRFDKYYKAHLYLKAISFRGKLLMTLFL